MGLFEEANYYLENEIEYDGGCVFVEKSHYYDFFVESAETDYIQLQDALMLYKDILSSLEKAKDEQISIKSPVGIEKIYKNINLVAMSTKRGPGSYGLIKHTIKLPCVDFDVFSKEQETKKIVTDSDVKQFIKKSLITYFKNNRANVVHELIHYVDNTKEKIPYKTPPVYGSPDYYNAPHEFNAYFNEIVLAVHDSLINNPVFSIGFLEFCDEDGIDLQGAFDYLIRVVNYDYRDVLKNLNDKYRKKMVSRLYKMFDYAIPREDSKSTHPINLVNKVISNWR